MPPITAAPYVNFYLRGPSVFCAQTQKRKIDRKGYRELRGEGGWLLDNCQRCTSARQSRLLTHRILQVPLSSSVQTPPIGLLPPRNPSKQPYTILHMHKQPGLNSIVVKQLIHKPNVWAFLKKPYYFTWIFNYNVPMVNKLFLWHGGGMSPFLCRIQIKMRAFDQEILQNWYQPALKNKNSPNYFSCLVNIGHDPNWNFCKIMTGMQYFTLIFIIPGASKAALMRNVSCGLPNTLHFSRKCRMWSYLLVSIFDILGYKIF